MLRRWVSRTSSHCCWGSWEKRRGRQQQGACPTRYCFALSPVAVHADLAVTAGSQAPTPRTTPPENMQLVLSMSRPCTLPKSFLPVLLAATISWGHLQPPLLNSVIAQTT